MGRQREHTADPLKILSGNQPEDGGGASETTSHPVPREREREGGRERDAGTVIATVLYRGPLNPF